MCLKIYIHMIACLVKHRLINILQGIQYQFIVIYMYVYHIATRHSLLILKLVLKTLNNALYYLKLPSQNSVIYNSYIIFNPYIYNHDTHMISYYMQQAKLYQIQKHNLESEQFVHLYLVFQTIISRYAIVMLKNSINRQY